MKSEFFTTSSQSRYLPRKSGSVMQSPPFGNTAQQKRCRLKKRQYTSRACVECCRRKVKCSGGTLCANCTITVSVCRYEERLKECRGSKKLAAAASIGREEHHDTGGIALRMRALEEEVHALRLALGVNRASHEHELWPTDNGQEAWMGRYDSDGKHQERIGRLSNVAPQRASADISEHDTWPDMLMAGYLHSLLADTARLKSGVKAFFEEFAHFFPCLQLDEFCPRLFNLFQICPSGPHGLLLPIERESEISLVVLTCMVLAVSELLRADGPSDSADYHSHQTWYRESQRLRLRHSERPLRDLDILRTYLSKPYTNWAWNG
ncbi:hypothetical protein ABHI18_012670 [Aspergillus niger]